MRRRHVLPASTDDTIGTVFRTAEARQAGSGWRAIESETDRACRWRNAKESAHRVGVDVENVLANARRENTDALKALGSATKKRETEITTAARAGGLDDDTIGTVFRAAEARQAGSGWRAIESETDRACRWRNAKESAHRVGVDVENVLANARRENTDALKALGSATEKRQTEIKTAARAAGLDDETIGKVFRAAEVRQAGSGWRAIESATERACRWRNAKESAHRVGVNVENVLANARRENTDALKALGSATEKRQTEIKTAARAAGLDDETIGKVFRAAEAGQAGSGWRAIESETDRACRLRNAKESAHRVGVNVENVLANARRENTDALKALGSATKKRETEITTAARAGGLDDDTIGTVFRAAEARQAGSGWRAIESETDRACRWRNAKESAHRVGVDVENVLANARRENTDALKALGSATEKRQTEIKTAARAAGLDDETIGKVFRAAEAGQAGSGWRAIESATERACRLRNAKESAHRVGVNVENVLANARRENTDALKALGSATEKRQTEIKTAARAAGLDDETIGKVFRAAEAGQAGSGWRAIESETDRACRLRNAKESAHRVGVNVENVLANARRENTDALKALGSATKKRETEITTAARAGGLDDDTIGTVFRAAEARQAGSGWRAIESETDRACRWRNAKESAHRVGVNVENVLANARRENTDALKALGSATEKRQTEIKTAARAAGLDDETIGKVFRAAEVRQAGSGWRAIESATERACRWRNAKESAHRVGVNVENVLANARRENTDALKALGSATEKRQTEIKTAARAAGLDDETIGKVFRAAEAGQAGSGWRAIEQATAEESRVREVIEKICEELGFSPSVALVCAVGRSLREEYDESTGAGRLATRLEALPDGYYGLSSDEQEDRTISERLHRENIAEQERRDQAARERYRKEKAEYKKKSFWERRRHAAPEEPQPGPVLSPPSDDQIEEYRRGLIARLRQFVVNMIEKVFGFWDRLPPPLSEADHPAPRQALRNQTRHDRGRHWDR